MTEKLDDTRRILRGFNRVLHLGYDFAVALSLNRLHCANICGKASRNR